MPIDLPRERNAETREMVQYFRHVTEIREALRGEEGTADRRATTSAADRRRGTVRMTSAAAGVGASAGRSASRLREWAPPILLFVGFLVAWELIVRVFDIDQFVLPSPVAIGVAWVTYLPELSAAARYTVVEIVAGLLIGATAGILAGAVTSPVPARAGLAHAVRRGGELRPDPGLRAAVQQLVRPRQPALEGDGRGGPVLLPGAHQHGPRPDDGRPAVARAAPLVRDARAAGVPQAPVPNALPYVFTALRLAVTLATIGAIVGEYFAAPRASLGQYIATYSAFLDFERSWAAIVFACAIGIGLYLVVVVVERLVMPWHERRAWS